MKYRIFKKFTSVILAVAMVITGVNMESLHLYHYLPFFTIFSSYFLYISFFITISITASPLSLTTGCTSLFAHL